MYDGNKIQLINTCPIDNLLYFYYLIMKDRPYIAEEYKRLSEQFAKCLVEACQFIAGNFYARGKVCGFYRRTHLI